MEDKDGINVTKTLMQIKEDVATIKAEMKDVGETDKKADKALAVSTENTHDISRLTTLLYWLYGIIISTGIIGIGVYVIEKYL